MKAAWHSLWNDQSLLGQRSPSFSDLNTCVLDMLYITVQILSVAPGFRTHGTVLFHHS